MAYTPTVYTNDASSPDLDSTNLNKSEQGIKLAHDIAVPVDCSSRVAEYTGDGIPLIPDNVAGRTYFQDEWATTDGWETNNSSLSVSGGMLKITSLAAIVFGASKKVSELNGKLIVIRLRSSLDNNVRISYYNGSSYTTIKSVEVNKGTWYSISCYLPSGSTNNAVFVTNQTPGPAGSALEIETIYIGTGVYDTPVLDRAGNSNSLALNAVTPVNGKYGKEMSFNGSTSYAQASAPVIGTTGTIKIRFKLGSLGIAQAIVSNITSGNTNGCMIYTGADNILYFRIAGATFQNIQIATIVETTNYHTLTLKVGVSSLVASFDSGAEVTTPITVTPVASSTNMTIGSLLGTLLFFNGIISHFRYDSRIWTADEARAWSLNPISIDSRV